MVGGLNAVDHVIRMRSWAIRLWWNMFLTTTNIWGFSKRGVECPIMQYKPSPQKLWLQGLEKAEWSVPRERDSSPLLTSLLISECSVLMPGKVQRGENISVYHPYYIWLKLKLTLPLGSAVTGFLTFHQSDDPYPKDIIFPKNTNQCWEHLL